ncbi:MAG: DNA-3-methyladenine glycosylase I [Stenotrophomonas maltophilia]
MPHEEFHDPLAPPDPLRDWYVNTIWGKRVDDDDLLFEVMSLQVFQAGLTCRKILNKRDGFRSAFYNWSIGAVAGFGPAEVEALRNDPGIIRNRLKIQATVENARTALVLQSEHGSFCNWFYHVLEGTEYPEIQKTLRGTFKFMGPEISRMWLMASGRITREEGDKYRP